MRRLEHAFRETGYATLNLDYPARTAPLERLVALIAPPVAAFSETMSRLHVVTHSMGGLLARALIAENRPENLGRVVMLAPPNGGSEVADKLHRTWAYRRFFGPAGAQLVTQRDLDTEALLGGIDYPLGIIAGDRSLYLLESLLWLSGPNDGRVTVARTRVHGMSDHVTLHADHATMMWNRDVIAQAVGFVRHGRFGAG